LRRAAEIIVSRAEDFVATEVADTGKPVAQARELDVARASANFRSFADTVSPPACRPTSPSCLRRAGAELRGYASRSAWWP
jgi:acyl-CoA reductase-like NAD-dependent aldehyde dehydrogenase